MPRMMSAPAARTSPGLTAFTVAAVAVLGYIFGAPFALASGCLYVVLWPLSRPLRGLGLHGRGCLTGLATVAPLLVFMAQRPDSRWGMDDYLMFLVPAAVCGMLAAGIRDTDGPEA